MLLKHLGFLTQLSDDPPRCGSHVARAPHGKHVEWQCVASCVSPKCKGTTLFWDPDGFCGVLGEYDKSS